MEDFILEFEDKKVKGQINKIYGCKWKVADPKLVLCIIHGMGEHSGRYADFAKFFNDQGISVYSIDLKGHGHSYGMRGDCSPRSIVLDHITSLIEYAAGENPESKISLFGHSLGGNILLDYRYRGKLNAMIDSYVVSAPWVVLQKHFSPLYLKTLRLVAKINPHHLIKTDVRVENSNKPTASSSEKTQEVAKDPLLYNKTTLRCAVEGFDIADKMARNKIHAKGDGIKRPMLLIHGTRDAMCKVEGSQRIKDNEGDICRLKIWEGAKHRVFAGSEKNAGEEILAYVRDFLFENGN